MKQTMKRAMLSVGRPIWRRLSPKFYLRIDRRIDMRLANSEADWKLHVPAFLNAVSSVQAFGREIVRSRKDLHNEIVELRDTLQRQDELLSQALQALQGQVELLHEAIRAQGAPVQDDRDALRRIHNGLQSPSAEAAGRKDRGM